MDVGDIGLFGCFVILLLVCRRDDQQTVMGAKGNPSVGQCPGTVVRKELAEE